MKKVIFALFLIPFLLNAQSNEELKQRVNAFVADADTGFTKKVLNLSGQDIGSIDETDFEWSEYFMLKSKTKRVNSIGNKVYPKYYFSFFTYYDKDERDYGMKIWLKDFIEHASIRAGRDMRTFAESQPTIIVINETNVSILTYQCVLEDYDEFKMWRKTMLKWFGSPASVMIEINCGGPLKWTKNPPDPKDRSWR